MFSSTFNVKHKYIAKVEHLAMMCSTDIEDHIRELMENKGWCDNIYNYFCEQIYLILDRFIITYDDAKLCESDLAHMVKQKRRNNKIFTKLLQLPYFNFFDIVLKDRKVKFLNNVEILKAIYKLRYDSIGLGEVFLTLFSECKSSDKGDIIVDGKVVELKGERGYIGTECYWQPVVEKQVWRQNIKSHTKAIKAYLNTVKKNEITELIELRTDRGNHFQQKKLLSEIRQFGKYEAIDNEKLVLAIQIYSYRFNLPFDYLIFINEDKAACIRYDSLTSIYDQLCQFEFSLQVPNSFVRNKGYVVTLKKKLNNEDADI